MGDHSLFPRHFITFRYVGQPRDFTSPSFVVHVMHSLLSSDFNTTLSSYFTELLVATSNLWANASSLMVSAFNSASVFLTTVSSALFTDSNCFSKQVIFSLSFPVQGLSSTACVGPPKNHKPKSVTATTLILSLLLSNRLLYFMTTQWIPYAIRA